MHDFKHSIPLTLLSSLLLVACGTNSKNTTTNGTSQLSEPVNVCTLSATKATPERSALPYPTNPAKISKQRLPRLGAPTPQYSASAHTTRSSGPLSLTSTTTPIVVGMKVLIIHSASPAEDGSHPDYILDAATTLLEQSGIPYDTLAVSPQRQLTESDLLADDGSHGKYQGVILTTNNLAYFDQATRQWKGAFDQVSWDLLWAYERTYKVRQLALYSYPSQWPEDYGLREAGAGGAHNTATLTSDGKGVFTDLTANSVPINHAWTYPARIEPTPGITTTPLINGTCGTVLGVRSDTSDGRERIALTFAHNPYHLHSQLFSHGLIHWLTNGVYLGDARRHLQVDIDDWFLADDRWDPATNTINGSYRISASDAIAANTQQQTLQQRYPTATSLKWAVMFNAGGANTAAPRNCNPRAKSPDPLTSVSKCLASAFDWVNHTLDHESMDFATYDLAYTQINDNTKLAQALNLTYDPRSLVTGEHSGLGWFNEHGLSDNKTDYGLERSNQAFLNAAADAGVQFIASNRSVNSHWDATCINCGVTHPLKTNLFLVPRWPTNIFYYATNPDEVTSSYNHVYGPSGQTPFWDHDLTYAEILDKESEIALHHVLSGSPFPHYMHQSNLREYRKGHSLVYDWTDAVLRRYSQYSNLPLRTLPWKDLGEYLKQRTTFQKANVHALWDRTNGRITLTSNTATDAFLTGVRAGTTETYGSSVISRITLNPNQPLTVEHP